MFVNNKFYKKKKNNCILKLPKTSKHKHGCLLLAYVDDKYILEVFYFKHRDRFSDL